MQQRQVQPVGIEDFRRAQALELRGERFGRTLQRAQLAVGKIEPCQPQRAALQGERRQQAIAPLVQQGGVGKRAGGDDAGDGALHRPFAGGFTDLFGNHHRFAQPHQPREVLVDGMNRHARHANRHTRRLAARGQRDVQQLRGAFGVFIEEFVKIPHAVEQQHVWMLVLDGEILPHHRRVLCFDAGGGGMRSA